MALSVASWIFLKPQGPHGGVVKKADNFYIEMKSDEKNLSAFLFDRKLKAVEAIDLQGDVRFHLQDSTDVSVPLTRLDGNEFKCVPPTGFYSCRVTFRITGKSISANFFNPLQVVLKR
ncbi:MAG: hypothetical protein ACXVC6_09940 [Bacteroidia bacterium]